jgi:hypothetical protein
MTDQIIIKKGRVRIKQGYAGIYIVECRLSWWLPFWWDMGHTTYLDVAENHIKWIEENIL